MNRTRRRSTVAARLAALLLLSLALLLLSHPERFSAAAAADDGGKRKKGVPRAIPPSGPPSSDDDEEYDDDSDDVSGDSGDGDDDYDSTDGDDEDYFDEEYELKIEQAMEHHESKVSDLISRALKEGGAGSGLEIGPDGDVAGIEDGDVEDLLWKAEFAVQGLAKELETLLELRRSQEDNSEDGSGDDYGDEDGDGNYVSANEFDYVDYDPTLADTDPILKDDPEFVKILDAIEDDGVRNDLYGDVDYEHYKKSKLDPERWYAFTYWELHSYFGCARVFGASRPVYDTAKWEEVREFWRRFVVKDLEELAIPEGKPERTYQLTKEEHFGPLVPFQTAEKGRGLKAGRDIARGELVFKGTNNTIIFTHGHTWRKFLFEIYDNFREGEQGDAETTCDVLVWSWVQTLEEGGDLVIVADLDNGSLLNEGRDEKGWEAPNVRCGKDGDTICYMEYYATKDIKEGDELLCDYRGFALLDAWQQMGL